ncbi:MAG: response regulator transcription factor [Gorillibacterium sp.]|nr:response regulator transcription factor [Gorillibacterium sp.]
MYKVVIADDHPYARLGLHILLESGNEYCIVGEATNANEAIVLSEDLLPDLLLTDLKMPGVSIIEGAKQLKGINPKGKIIILTAFDDCEDIYRAVKAGVDGYLMKGTDPEHILLAIYQVMNGSTFFQSKENTEFMGGRGDFHED